MGWVSLVAAELMGASSGLGHGVQVFSLNLEISNLYASICVIGVPRFTFNILLVPLMALDPACLLLDEPFQGLDDVIRESLYRKLVELITDRSVRAIIATHDLDEAALIADHVLLLKGPGNCVLSQNVR